MTAADKQYNQACNVLLRIALYCKKIEQLMLAYTDPDAFEYSDFWIKDSVAMNLQQIGEEASEQHAGAAGLREKYAAEIPWQDWADFRNVLTHNYGVIDYRLVWEIATNEVPEIYEQVDKILRSMKPNYMNDIQEILKAPKNGK